MGVVIDRDGIHLSNEGSKIVAKYHCMKPEGLLDIPIIHINTVYPQFCQVFNQGSKIHINIISRLFWTGYHHYTQQNVVENLTHAISICIFLSKVTLLIQKKIENQFKTSSALKTVLN